MKELDDDYIKKIDAEIKEKTGCKNYIWISQDNRIDVHYIN